LIKNFSILDLLLKDAKDSKTIFLKLLFSSY